MTTATMPPPQRLQKKSKIAPRTLGRLAKSIPEQGQWTLEDFDFFSARIGEYPWLELSDGRLIEKAVPTFLHATLVRLIFLELQLFVTEHKLGIVYLDGTEFRISETKVRYPDVLFVCNENAGKHEPKGVNAVDLAVEVLSPSTRVEDLGAKRVDYAAGNVQEYWLVDPDMQQVTVLKLKGGAYAVHGKYKCGEKAQSALLKGFSLDVSAAFAGLKG